METPCKDSIELWKNTDKQLRGSERRKFRAGVVRSLGRGGQCYVEKIFKWDRNTIRKGEHELSSGINNQDQFHLRGRKPAEYYLPSLLDDIKTIIEPCSQTDPTFKSTRIYTPLTAATVRTRLLEKFNYTDSILPCVRILRNKINGLGFLLKKVKKCKPLKKIAETNAIFGEVHRVNKEADGNPRKLRISLDTKAVVKIGDFSRGGYNRQGENGLDHDFGAKEKLTPFGIILPETKETFFWMATSKVTADFMVDRLEELYPKLLERCPELDSLVINADNGCESSGRRTQWLKRLREFSNLYNITIELAYYPPYHSKYNPIERCWGVLENHWRGEILSTVEKVLGLARSMTYAGVKPVVRLVRKVYHSKITVAKSEMQEIEETLNRKPGLEKWFILLKPQKQSDFLKP